MAIDDMVVVRREIVLPVERERAWQALQDPAELGHWLADEVELEIAPGAEGWLRTTGQEPWPVTVEEVAPQRRVVLRWCAPGAAETLVELVLDDVPGGTRLVVIELPVSRLEAVGRQLQQARPVSGPQMLAGVA